MLTYTYVDKGKFALIEKEKLTIIETKDAGTRLLFDG